MTQNTATIRRQAALFNEVRQFLHNDFEKEFGYNIPMEYDIILSIYTQVSEDLRKPSIRYQSDLIWRNKK